MRTIKFRGKKKYSEEWVYGYCYRKKTPTLFSNEVFRYYYIIDEIGSETCIDENTLGQFTGFYDKNGNEIYEGDILKPLNEHFTYVVKFGNGCFYIEYILGKWNTLERGIEVYKNFDRDIEIIGNIHENPELLEL